MPEEGTDNEAQATPLLQADEPAPFGLISESLGEQLRPYRLENANG